MKIISSIAAIVVAGMCTIVSANEVTIATGEHGKGYYTVGKQVGAAIVKRAESKRVPVTVNIMTTAGSVENLELLNDGDVDVAIAQMDAINVAQMSRGILAKPYGTETVFWVYNKKHGILDLEDIEGNEDYVIVLVEGSGAQVTMRSFAQEDAGYLYNLNSAVLVDSAYDAADLVSQGKVLSGPSKGKKVAGLIYVGSSMTSEISEDFNNLVIGELTDGDFNDAVDINGEGLYTSCDISSKITDAMPVGTILDPDTVCVRAAVVYAADIEGKLGSVVKRGVNRATSGGN